MTNDPFAQFMDLWAPSVGVEDAFHSWGIKEEQQESAYVMPDIEPFRATSGRYISGRSAWREHLARTGNVEMGHADLKRATENHEKRKAREKESLTRAQKLGVQAKHVPFEQPVPQERSRMSVRVAERLHGRPAPDRKTLIKIALEEGRRK